MIVHAVLMATGAHSRPGRVPYVWRDPAASPRRTALTAAILTAVGDEPDAWDSPPPAARKPNSGLPWLMGCGTTGAFQRHRRNGEKPCPDCMDAQRRYKARRKAQRITDGTWRRRTS